MAGPATLVLAATLPVQAQQGESSNSFFEEAEDQVPIPLRVLTCEENAVGPSTGDRTRRTN